MTLTFDQFAIGVRLEIVPIAGAADLVRALPPGTHPITVTCSPKLGVDRTVELCEELARRGHEAVPHLAAHIVRGRSHLEEITGRLRAAGIDEVFAVGGDGARHRDAYRSGIELVADIAASPERPVRIGVPGYPEGHPLVADDALLAALAEKARSCSYVVTQMCFEPERVRSWIQLIRDHGIDLPVVLGVPGAVKRRKLLEMSMKIGVGSSLRYLSKNSGAIGALARHRRFDPASLVDAVAAGTPGVAGVHLFTFNQFDDTLRWLARHGRLPASVSTYVP